MNTTVNQNATASTDLITMQFIEKELLSLGLLSRSEFILQSLYMAQRLISRLITMLL